MAPRAQKIATAAKSRAPSARNGASKPQRSTASSASASARGAALSSAQLVELYRAMLRVRILDDRMITLQRQGRIGFYGACTGQEAATMGTAYALEKTDWIFPALREASAMLLRGFPLVPYLSQVFGNSADVTKGRQMPSHQAARVVNQVSWSSCIGTQLPQAVGAAMAAKAKKAGTVTMAYMGDGATSSSDFHVALNFAGVFKAPVVFVCQNNHWSISMRTDQQTASESIAIKAKAYGFPGVKVDGNDVEAVFAAAKAAVARARSGAGPTLIEAETYRMGAHSTSDDPTRYRDPKEVELWKTRDPIERLHARLVKAKAWDARRDEALRTELLAEINAAIKEAESYGPPPDETMFEDLYADAPWNLAEQREEYLRYLQQAGAAARGDHSR